MRKLFLYLGVICIGALALDAQEPVFNQEQQRAIESRESRILPTDENLRPRDLSEEVAKGKIREENQAHLNETVVEELRGIFVASEGEKHLVKPGIESSFPLKNEAKLVAMLKPFLKKKLTFGGLKEVREKVERYFEEQERMTILAVVPDQEATSGGILIWISESKIGFLEIGESRWGNEGKFKKEFGYEEGDPLHLPSMKKKIDWMNENSFSQADLYIGAERKSLTDFKIGIRDRFPVRFYAGYDDSGTDITGDVRWAGGVNWGNVTKWGDRLDYQFLTTSSLEYLQAHSLSYRYPFSWGHRAQISGSWAKVKGDFAEVDQIDLTGRSAQVTGRYEMPLPKLRDWTHAIDVGVEAKQSKSDLMIRSIPVSKSSTEIVQFLASYHGQAPDAWGSTSFEATIYESPGGLTGQNKDSSFGPARRNTPSTYRYGTFMLERRTNLILGVSLRNEARYQMSNNNLLGSEQFGAGGWETVRGYDERESSGDEGWLMRHEIWSPSFSFGEWATENKIGDYRKMKDQLQGFLFWDYAVTMNRRLLPSENPDTELSSLGAGMRYRVSTYLSLRADYGFQLLDTGANKRNDGRFHLGMMLSY